MALKTTDKFKASRALFYRVEYYTALVNSAFNSANKEAAKLAVSLGYDGAKPFKFSDYPTSSSKMKRIVESLYSSINLIVVNGIKAEWENAELFNDDVVTNALGMYGVELEKRLDVDGNPTDNYKIPEKFKHYFRHSDDALSAFLKRTDDAVNLSERIWNLTDQYKENLELVFSDGLRDGTSAAKLSRSIKEYLNEPDKLFRRVKNSKDNLVLSKAAKNYNPGVGQYRSSSKNAMRVSRSVINMSYASADFERAQILDFVVGVEIHRSNKGCKCSRCEMLKGKYPKTFNFSSKWHPQCLCYLTYIMKSEEEFWSDSSSSVNEIADVPNGFKDYLNDNSAYISKATKNGTLPYFLRDNKGYLNEVTPKSKIRPISSIGFDGGVSPTEQEAFNNVIGGFDLHQLDDNLMKLLNDNKIDVSNVTKRMSASFSDGRGGVNLSYSCSDFKIERSFKRRGDELFVEHSYFRIDSKLQGNGLSKDTFNIFYQQYKNAGIKRIEVHANIDIGGYTWARYGFSTSEYEATSIVRRALRLESITDEEADIFNKIISSNVVGDRINMRCLTDHKASKRLLLGSDWEGNLDLTNEVERVTFEKYLSR